MLKIRKQLLLKMNSLYDIFISINNNLGSVNVKEI